MTRKTTIVRLAVPVVLAFALVAAFFAARASSASTTPKQLVVRTVSNPTLHKKVLVTRKGLTLYSLSAEKRGKFICTDNVCLSLWMPLVVSKGITPTGAPHLAVVRRPDGRLQASFRGLPLYTFTADRKPGDVKGNGFRDVGVWRPAFAVSSPNAAPPPPSPYPTYPGYGG